MSTDPIDIHIGSRLRSLRERRDMTLSAVAREVGMSYQQVRKYESGDNRISASTLYRLAKLLDVETAFFFEGLPMRVGAPGEGADGVDPSSASEDEAMALALGQIEDAEIRRHMSGLLQVLKSRRRAK